MKQKIKLLGEHVVTVHLLFEGAVIVPPVRDEPIDQSEMDFLDNDSSTRVIDDRSEFGDPLEQLIAAEEAVAELAESADSEGEGDKSEHYQDPDSWIDDYIASSLLEEKYQEESMRPHFFGGTLVKTVFTWDQEECKWKRRDKNSRARRSTVRHLAFNSRESLRQYYGQAIL